jgi:hypothetical protein
MNSFQYKYIRASPKALKNSPKIKIKGIDKKLVPTNLLFLCPLNPPQL